MLGNITVLLQTSGPTVLEGVTICGRFAAHVSTKYPDGKHFVVTHIKSGMRVGGFQRTLRDAKDIAAELDCIGSAIWNFKERPDSPIVMNQLRMEARAAGVTFHEDNFAARVEGQHNAVNRARMIEKRYGKTAG